MNYGDQQLSLHGQAGNSVQVIFDSGSSYTYLPDDIYKNIVAAVSVVINFAFGSIYPILFTNFCSNFID